MQSWADGNRSYIKTGCRKTKKIEFLILETIWNKCSKTQPFAHKQYRLTGRYDAAFEHQTLEANSMQYVGNKTMSTVFQYFDFLAVNPWFQTV